MEAKLGKIIPELHSVEVAKSLAEAIDRGQRLMTDFIERHSLLDHPVDGGMMQADPLNIGSAFVEMAARLISHPTQLVEANLNLWQNYMSLWQRTTRRMLGEEIPPLVEPEAGDRRFKDEMWQVNEIFDFIKQSYLLSSRWVQGLVHSVDGLDPQTARKVDFYTRQFVDALAPSNFVMTNPEVLRATVESGGENLLKGLNHLLADLERGKGKLAISMTDYDAFKVGENIAQTKGKVVFRNDLMELIQYAPTTDTVCERPLLIVPPWINKYYILDLRPQNSFVSWATAQGLTVFLISWVNPDAHLSHKSFEDYMLEGPLAAADAICKTTGVATINALGFCIGGTLLASTLAYLAAKGESPIASATLLTTLTDFANPGEIKVFIDDVQVAHLEEKMAESGFLDGRDMATTFNMLRENDLIWSFVINNYLLGKEPFPFDLLYWNSDSTRMPAAMHSFYLRHMYQENKLIEPGGISLGGVPIDLGKIKTPLYMLSTREDHIAPWTSTYALTRRVAGPVRFVLSGSGHIAGVVNPPAAKKYGHWVNTRRYKDPDAWLKSAKLVEGSWWLDWRDWIVKHSGKQIPARDPATGALPPLCEAPGTYVKVRLG